MQFLLPQAGLDLGNKFGKLRIAQIGNKNEDILRCPVRLHLHRIQQKRTPSNLPKNQPFRLHFRQGNLGNLRTAPANSRQLPLRRQPIPRLQLLLANQLQNIFLHFCFQRLLVYHHITRTMTH